MSDEQKLVKDALERLNAYTGLPVEIERPGGKVYDFVIRIADIRFMAVVKSVVSQGNKNLIYAPLANEVKHSTMPLIIIAERIPNLIAKEYTEIGINYLDKAGNCHIHSGKLRIVIEGKKMEKTAGGYQSRAFQEAGIRIIFQLLTDPAVLTLPYREIAERARVSLGSVGSVIRELTDLDFVFEAENKRVLKNTSRLLERWVTAYHDVLRPRLLIKRLRFTQPEQLYDWDTKLLVQNSENILLWGGEPGASLLTNHLTPEKFTLYTDGHWQEVMRTLKLLPAENGDIEVLEMFWHEENKYRDKPIVPPLLIYADLMGSRIGRNLETANLIRENELSPLFQRV
jgi:hypothetical protein